MTVFDILRWSISIPPTADELVAIPTKLYREWVQRSHWREADTESSWDQAWVAGWMHRNWVEPRSYMVQEEIIEDIQLLRKMIGEWSE